MIEVPSQIINSSAIPAWSGFVYQGKVALYHAIRLLVQRVPEAHFLNVEHLDDFVIRDCEGNVLSLHQVKAMKSDKRYSYYSALQQASAVSERCNEHTVRWFHVSVGLDDMSDRAANAENGEHLVQFYQYHDERYYVETNFIDIKLNEIVEQYLESYGLPSTELLIAHKLARLHVLLAGRVNLAHYRNQHESMNKFEAADSIPIYFSEIEGCLHSEVIHNDDHEAILFEFRRTLLNRTDQILDSLQEDGYIDLNGICKCRFAVANMDIQALTRLYYSKKPNQKEITLVGFSNDTVDHYLRIILGIMGVKTSKDLPHYFKSGLGSYLPTAMKFDFLNMKLDVKQIQENVDGLRGNLAVQDVLYDYDNLVVHMDSKPFLLSSESSSSGKFTEISENDKNRITKINNVRFVSVRDASDEIND
ncbi:ABC-three component system protein [Vibrio jasicida]|uniref:ABC-three component system protein n=1 Tax=Vibrio jasicida TaxID=766224 RepID=UPI0011B08CE2|nr:ABC-three component system protein [Vibrio jasicida]